MCCTPEVISSVLIVGTTGPNRSHPSVRRASRFSSNGKPRFALSDGQSYRTCWDCSSNQRYSLGGKVVDVRSVCTTLLDHAFSFSLPALQCAVSSAAQIMWTHSVTSPSPEIRVNYAYGRRRTCVMLYQ